MNNAKYDTPEKILEKARSVIGVPFKAIDKHQRLSNGKGNFGHMIEESLYGYDINSRSEADFIEAGIELKVTPIVKSGNKYRSKERLVLNIINYEDEYLHTFKNSHFWEKNHELLLMFYEYIKNVSKENWSIREACLFNYPEEDLIIIKSDWEKIIEKIKTGKAHEISEGDTMYLGACTKGSTAAKSYRTQPFSNIPAKQRAFSLKQSYMTYIVQNFIFGQKKDERIIKNFKSIKNSSFDEYVLNKIMPYIGKSQEELCDDFNINSSAKNLNSLIISRILDIKGDIKNTEEFKKANIIPKTIRVNTSGTIKESMSFPIFNFCEIIDETWFTSTFKEYIESAKFLFVIFRFSKDNKLFLNKVMFWHIPPDDLEQVHNVWQKTVDTLKNGVEFTETSRGTCNNLPKASDNPVAHVRPHARNSQDTLPLPTGGSMPKQCFWLNGSYIKTQIDIH